MPQHAMAIPDGAYYGLAWLPDGALVTVRTRAGQPLGGPEVVVFDSAAGDGRVLSMPTMSGCRLTTYDFPGVLDDGRLSLVRTCTGPTADATAAVVAVDASTGQSELLADLDGALFPSGTSWNPKLARAVAAQSSSICASLSWITRRGQEDLRLTLGEGDRRWRLDHELHVRRDCDGGRADWPAWSPDGRAIAFFASPASVGLHGPSRLDAPWNLYVMDPETLTPRKVVDGVREARATAWSPDGRWVAYSSRDGVYLVEVAAGTPTRIAVKAANWLAWSPDGGDIAMLIEDERAAPETFQMKFARADVRALTEGT